MQEDLHFSVVVTLPSVHPHVCSIYIPLTMLEMVLLLFNVIFAKIENQNTVFLKKCKKILVIPVEINEIS